MEQGVVLHVHVLRGGDAARGRSSIKAWLSDIAGHTKDLIAEIDEANFVVMASAGEDAQGASVIGEACLARNVTTIGLVVQSPETSEADLSRTLSHMRPSPRCW